jgi:tellurite resistance protein TehA-like permease
MATAIVSIACQTAGREWISVVLLWLAVLAFVPLAAIDVARARHPRSMLHEAGDPGRGFPALGFVADTCVLGARLITGGSAARVVAAILLGCGSVVWLVIAVALVRTRAGGNVNRARGEWLLAVVATEGLAILAGKLGSAGYGAWLRALAVALWVLGGVLYVGICIAIARRLARRPLRAGELTPDWWIVMGAAAITAVAAVTVRHDSAPAAYTVGLIALAFASAGIPVLVAGEVWQARRIGVPKFTPARWTMVFPLGMYSVAAQLVGETAGARWVTDLGRAWVLVALAAWLVVAVGEIHFAFRDPAEAEHHCDSRPVRRGHS